MTSFFNSRNYFYDFHSYGIVSYRLMLPTYICMCIKLHSLILYSRQTVNYYNTFPISFFVEFVKIWSESMQTLRTYSIQQNLPDERMCLCLFMSFRFLLIPLDTSACQGKVSTKNANVLTIITQSKLCVFYVNSIHVIFFNIMGIVRVSTACLSSYLRRDDHVIPQLIYHVT